MIDLTGKTALVTGSSRGIGRATALRLAEAGADVVVNYVSSKSAAAEVAEQIRALGRRAVTVRADLAEREDIESLVDFVRQEFGRLDILVSNAASGGFRELESTTDRHFDATMHTNVRALLLLVQAALPLLERPAPERAKVVALSSHGSHRALPHYALIGASKAALEALVRHCALELGPRGINFNVVLAGLVDTDSTRQIPQAEALFAGHAGRLLVGPRALLPGDVADAVLFLVSPLADLVQGATLVVDGGESLHG
jgi:enoyl-[acyl-carrier protein] reductase III